jgi:hypothetical protein
MMECHRNTTARFMLFFLFGFTAATAMAQQYRIELKPTMLTNEAQVGDPAGIIDEQREIIGPPAGAPNTSWEVNSRHWNQFPVSVSLDLGEEKNLSSLWIFDTDGKGDVVISAGRPGQWEEVATYDCAAYLKWAEVHLDVTTRYLRLTRMTPGANFSEVARLRDSGSTIKETTDAPTSASDADGTDTTITKRPIDSRKTRESTPGFEKE